MKKRFLAILLATTMVFSLVGCGNSGTEAEVIEQAGELESKVESVEEQVTSEVETEVVQEQSVTESVKLAIQEGNYDEAMGMLDEAKADMEVEEYALLMSNI